MPLAMGAKQAMPHFGTHMAHLAQAGTQCPIRTLLGLNCLEFLKRKKGKEKGGDHKGQSAGTPGGPSAVPIGGGGKLRVKNWDQNEKEYKGQLPRGSFVDKRGEPGLQRQVPPRNAPPPPWDAAAKGEKE